MFILQMLSAMALKPLISGACNLLGMDDPSEGTIERGIEKALQFLGDQFSDQSQRLTKALNARVEDLMEGLYTRVAAQLEARQKRKKPARKRKDAS